MQLYKESLIREVLDSFSEIQGYIITINNVDAFELTIWVEDVLFSSLLRGKILNKFAERVHEKGQEKEFERERFLGDIEFVSDENLIVNEAFAQELREKPTKHTYYPHLNSWFTAPHKFFTERKVPIVTFYSYKGGVSRTTALALTALKLANENYRVAVVDYDIEAPGLHVLLNPEKQCSEYGVLDYLRHQLLLNRPLTTEEMKKYYWEFSQGIKGSIALFPAIGNIETGYNDYVEKVAYVNFDNYSRRGYKSLEQLFKDIENNLSPDIILIDSRTGFSDIAGILLCNSDLVSFYFSNSEQSFDGMHILFNQLKKISELWNEELYMPPIVFNHSIVPNSSPKVRNILNEEAENRLKEILFEVYGENFSDPNFIEGEIKVNEIVREEFLEQVNFEGLTEYVEKYFNKSGYARLFEEIISMLEENHTQLTVPFEFPIHKLEKVQLVSKILEDLKEQYLDARDEKYDDEVEFKKTFYVSDEMIQMLDPKIRIILGAKGSGKTAIFRALLKQKDRILQYITEYKPLIKIDNVNFTVVNGFQIGAVNEYKKEPHIIEEINKKKSCGNPVLFWNRFWECLLGVQLLKAGILTSKNATEFLRQFNNSAVDDLYKLINDNNFMTDLRKEIMACRQGSYWILYDDLDKVFEGGSELQKDVVSGLITFWQEVADLYVNMTPKIFLRIDIYERTHFQNKVNISQWIGKIQWTQIDFHKLMLKRLLSISKTLREYFSYIKQEEEWWFETSEMGLEINDQQDYAYMKKMITLLFGLKLRDYSKSAKMWEWFKNHLSDGKENIYPRDLIIFLNEMLKEYRSGFEKYYNAKEERLFPSGSLFNRKVMQRVSESRYEAIYEEYIEYRELFEDFKNIYIPFPIYRNEIVKKFSDEMDLKHSNADEYVSILVDLGILRVYKANEHVERLTMPDLYLEGFKKKRKGPGFS